MTFKTNESGNPDGRPKGTGYRQQLFKALVEPHKEGLFEKGINLALEGNEAMLRLFLERMLPPKPKEEEPVCIPLVCDNLTEKSKRIMQGLSEGEITVSAAEVLMRTIYMEFKVYEAEVLKKQVEDLMKRAGKV